MPSRAMMATAAVLTAALAALGYLWSAGMLTILPVNAQPSGTPLAGGTAPAVAAQAAPAAPAPPPALLHAGPVTVRGNDFFSWSLLDRRTGELTGSPNAAATNVTASMTKAWLAADYLRRMAEQRKTPSSAVLKTLSVMIRDSDNAAANTISRAVGGNASIKRLVRLCRLTDSKPNADWANALMSARDAARMAACIADGRAAGQRWTDWVMTEMRAVRGVGRFGIITALPADEAKATAIKNGWVVHPKDGKWHVNCMAVSEDWALAVMVVYPAARGFPHGDTACQSVTNQLMS